MLKKTFLSLEKIKEYQLEKRKKELAESNLSLSKRIEETEKILKLISSEKEVMSAHNNIKFSYDSWKKVIQIELEKQRQSIIDAKQEVAAMEILLQNAWREKKSISVLLERIEKRQVDLGQKIERLQLDEFGIIKFANNKLMPKQKN